MCSTRIIVCVLALSFQRLERKQSRNLRWDRESRLLHGPLRIIISILRRTLEWARERGWTACRHSYFQRTYHRNHNNSTSTRALRMNGNKDLRDVSHYTHYSTNPIRGGLSNPIIVCVESSCVWPRLLIKTLASINYWQIKIRWHGGQKHSSSSIPSSPSLGRIPWSRRIIGLTRLD